MSQTRPTRCYTDSEISQWRRQLGVGDPVQLRRHGLTRGAALIEARSSGFDDMDDAAVERLADRLMQRRDGASELRTVTKATDARLTLDDGSIWRRDNGHFASVGESTDFEQLLPPDHDGAERERRAGIASSLSAIAGELRGGGVPTAESLDAARRALEEAGTLADL